VLADRDGKTDTRQLSEPHFALRRDQASDHPGARQRQQVSNAGLDRFAAECRLEP